MTTLTYTILALLFSIGFGFHVLKAADRGVDHGVSCTKRAWFTKYWSAVLIRWGMALVIFLIYTSDPELTAKLFGHFGFVPWMSLPVTKCTSTLLGYFADSALDLLAKKVPALSRELPSVDDQAA